MTRKIHLTPHQLAVIGASLAMTAQAFGQGGSPKLQPSKTPGGGQQLGRAPSNLFLKYEGKFIKHKGALTLAGLLKNSPVFKTHGGEFFTVEPGSGDLKFHTPQSLGYLKLGDKAKAPASAGMFIKFDGIKAEGRLGIVGVDTQNHVVMENARGEKFYLNPLGDMVFVK